VKDAIEVYFDNQIGIIEVETQEPQPKRKRPTKVAEGREPGSTVYQFDVLAILDARNEQEDLKGERIQAFESKISDLFDYVRSADDGNV
jgi:type I restriction enzyme R subunit